LMLQLFRYASLIDSSENLWDQRSATDPNFPNGSELPFEKSFSVNWKGKVPGTPLADGNYKLKVPVWDTEGVPNQAPTNTSDPTGIAKVEFKLEEMPATTASRALILALPEGAELLSILPEPDRRAAAAGQTLPVYSRYFPANRIFTSTARFRLPAEAA